MPIQRSILTLELIYLTENKSYSLKNVFQIIMKTYLLMKFLVHDLTPNCCYFFFTKHVVPYI